MVCILGEMIQESGGKLAKEISCQMQGMVRHPSGKRHVCAPSGHTVAKTMCLFEI